MRQVGYGKALPLLSVQAKKEQAYAADFDADEGWSALLRSYGEDTPAFVYGHTFLAIKPEAVARRLARTALAFARGCGLVPVAHCLVPFARGEAHAIWRFQWNAATVDRVRLTDRVNAKSASLLVLLRDEAPRAIPSSVKLWSLKGSAHPERRGAEHLRTAMRMHNRMLGFVHAPDEPADLVRELGILFDHDRLHALLAQGRRGAADAPRAGRELTAAVAALEDASEAHSVHPQEVLARLSDGGGPAVAPLLLNALADGTRLGLDQVMGTLEEAGIAPGSWDALTLAAELIAHDRANVAPILDARSVHDVSQTWASQGAAIQAALRARLHA